MDPKAQAASALLRRFSVALKIRVLYPPPSPVSDRAVAELLEGLHSYTGAYGPFAVRVSKRSFAVDKSILRDAASSNLAFQLYTRRVIGFTVMPGATWDDLNVFLAVMRMDRGNLEAAGGVAHLVLQAGVHSVKVGEISLSPGETSPDQSWDGLADLLNDGRLSPEDRETVMDTLRAGPRAIGSLLEKLHAMISSAVEGGSTESQVERAYHLLKNLDRLILNEPVEDHERLYINLAAALLLLGEPLKTSLERTLAAHADDDETARLLLDYLSGQRLAGIVPVSSLRARHGAELEVASVLTPEDLQAMARISAARSADRQQVTGEGRVAVGEDSPEFYLREVAAIDDASMAREVTGTLVDAFRNQDGESDLAQIAGSLEAHLSWLVEQREFRLLRTVLEALRDVASRSSAHGKVVPGLFGVILKDGPLRQMLEILWCEPQTESAEAIRACLEMLADKAVGSLMRILGEEPQASTRRMLCDVIVAIAANHVDEVGHFIQDPRWFVVRNAVHILGHLGTPEGIAYLGQLMGHPEYRVRREVVETLVRIGTDDAETRLVAFLDDFDERIRLKTVLSLSDAGVREAVPRLLDLLARPDLWNRHCAIKQEVIAALGRVRAKEALPVLARIAGTRIVIWSRSRGLRSLAREALVRIESAGSPREGPLPSMMTDAGRL